MNRMPDSPEPYVTPADPARPAAPASGTPGAVGGAEHAAHDAARAAADAPVVGRPVAGADQPGARAADGGTDGGRTAVGVAGGAAAGTLAGIQAGALAGAVTLGVGAVGGALMGAAAGAALAQDADPSRFTAEQDAHYRALYEGGAGGAGYDAVRPAYVFGHVAASEPALAGLTFDEAEPALERAWNDELRARAAGAAAWPDVRRYVHDAYAHARAEGAGERRNPHVVGSGGSAVDPVELDRAQHGLPSVGG